jgi:hypothetical protein
MALLFLRSLCRLDEVSFSGSTLAPYLTHLFARAFGYTLLLGVDVGVETGFHFLAFIAQPPAFAHLAGVGQPLQGLNMIVFFMMSSLHLRG